MADDLRPKVPPPPLPGKLPPKPAGAAPARPPLPGAPAPQSARPNVPPAAPRPGVKSAVPAPAAMPASAPASEVEIIRQQMETQINALQKQLQDEREKLLLQTVRAKEEEVMAAKVEESIKDIQDRLRREKREQELQEQLARADAQIKDMEQRLATERQTWVETLKVQISQRDTQDRDLERNFELKLKELERRWHEEKLGWSHALRNKEEDLVKLKRELETTVLREQQEAEHRIAQIELEREALRKELKDTGHLRTEEKASLIEKLEARDKDFLSMKAQQAMLVTQLRQEKERIEQMRQLLEKLRAEKNSFLGQLEEKNKEFFLLKTQFALFQTRAKSDQEKTLKEMVLYKELHSKERQQWEVSLKTKENEMALIRETIGRKDIEINTVARQYEEKLAAKDREIATWIERDRDAKVFMSRFEATVQELEGKNALGAEELKSLRQRMTAKEQEYAEVLSREQELRVTRALLEQRVTMLTDETQMLRNRIGEQQASFDKALAQAAEQRQAMERSLQEKERLASEQNARVRAECEEARGTIRERDEKIELLARDVRAAEHELVLLAEQHAKEKTDYEGTVEKAKESFRIQAAMIKSDLDRTEADKEALGAEIARLTEAAAAKDKEIIDVARKYQDQIKEIQQDAETKRKSQQGVLAKLQERNALLEKDLAKHKTELNNVLKQFEDTYRKKEQALAHEMEARGKAIQYMKMEIGRIIEEKEKISKSVQEAEEKHQAELTEMHERLMKRSDEYTKLLAQKDQELQKAQVFLNDFRDKLHVEVEQQFLAKVAKIEREKEAQIKKLSADLKALQEAAAAGTQPVSADAAKEMAALEQRVQDLARERTEAEQKAREQASRERQEWERRLQEKDQAIAQLKDQGMHTAEGSLQAVRQAFEQRLAEEKQRWEQEKAILQKSRVSDAEVAQMIQQIAQLRSQCRDLEARLAAQSRPLTPAMHEQTQPITPAAPVEPAGDPEFDQTMRLPVNLTVPPAPADDPTIFGHFQRFWKNLNEPVIEIGIKDEKEKNKNRNNLAH